MYQVLFWTYSKKHNSTAAPAPLEELADASFDCDLMDGSGLLAPTLQLNAQNPILLNYCYISAFNRYYFVNNWRYNLGLWTCELQVDVLASFKPSLLQQSVYVLRSATMYDLSIQDSAYPMEAGTSFMRDFLSNPFNTRYADGWFVAGIVNTDQNTIGAVSYYAFTAAQFRVFLGALMGNVTFYGVGDISENLTKVLANPFQYIVSCRWMPIAPDGVYVTLVNSVPLGWWSFTCDAYRLGANSIVSGSGYDLSIPQHPQIARGLYLKSAPYTDYYLIFPPFGAFSLPADKMVMGDTLSLSWSADYITGAAVLTAECNGALVTRVESILGAEIALAQMAPTLEKIGSAIFSQDVPQLPTTAGDTTVLGINLSEVGQKMSGAYRSMVDMPKSSLEVAAQTIVSGITNAFLTSLCPAQISGTNGGISGGRFNIELCAWFRFIADETLSEKGRPLCQNVRLSYLSGYVQCGETDIDIPCTKPELDALKMYLASGFFLE